jgi:outer membrane PBP1 activator LpoA protein
MILSENRFSTFRDHALARACARRLWRARIPALATDPRVIITNGPDFAGPMTGIRFSDKIMLNQKDKARAG